MSVFNNADLNLSGNGASIGAREIMSSEVKCSCQVCNGHIAFDATMAGQDIACPHCGMETKLFIPNIPLTTPPSPTSVNPQPQSQAVKGTILDFTVQTNSGIISGDDGKRYSFQGSEWKEAGKFPSKGMRVDFSPQSGQAASIYLAHGTVNTAASGDEKRECNRLTAGLLAIFLGCLGIHKFYMGQSQTGILYIVLGVITCGFGFTVTAIIGIVEGIVYLSMTQVEFERKYLSTPEKTFTPKEAIGKVITIPPAKRVLLLIVCLLVAFILLMVVAKFTSH